MPVHDRGLGFLQETLPSNWLPTGLKDALAELGENFSETELAGYLDKLPVDNALELLPLLAGGAPGIAAVGIARITRHLFSKADTEAQKEAKKEAKEKKEKKETREEYIAALEKETAGHKTDVYGFLKDRKDFKEALDRAIAAGIDPDEFVARTLKDLDAGEYDVQEERPASGVIQSIAGAIPGVDAENVLTARIASAGVYEVVAIAQDGTQVGPYYVEAAADGSFAQISVVDAQNRIAKEADLPEADVQLQEFTGPDGNIMLLNPITGEIKDTGFSTLEWQEYKEAKARTTQIDAAAETQQTLDNRVREDELKLKKYQIEARQELDEVKFGADELHRQSQMAEDARQFDESARLRSMAQQEDARANNIEAGFQTAQLRRDAINQMREVLSQPADYLARGFALVGQESPFGEVTQADLINSVTNEYNAYNDYLKTLGGGFTPAEYEEGPRAPEGYEPSEFQFDGFDADAALDAGAVASADRDAQDERERLAALAVVAANQATAGLNDLKNQAANLGFDPNDPTTWPEDARNQYNQLVQSQTAGTRAPVTAPATAPAVTSPALVPLSDAERREFGADADLFDLSPDRGAGAGQTTGPFRQQQQFSPGGFAQFGFDPETGLPTAPPRIASAPAGPAPRPAQPMHPLDEQRRQTAVQDRIVGAPVAQDTGFRLSPEEQAIFALRGAGATAEEDRSRTLASGFTPPTFPAQMSPQEMAARRGVVQAAAGAPTTTYSTAGRQLDEYYRQRALQEASAPAGYASPQPSAASIVADRQLDEYYKRRAIDEASAPAGYAPRPAQPMHPMDIQRRTPPAPVYEEGPGVDPLFMRGGGVTGFGNPVVVGDSSNGKENEELVMTFGSAPMIVLPLNERQEQIMARAAEKTPRARIGGGFGFQDFGGSTGFGNRAGSVSAGGFGINRMLQGPVSQSDIIGMSEKYATPRVSQVAAGRRPDPMQFGFALQTPGQLAALTADEREEFRTRLAARNVSLGDVETAVSRRYGRTGARRGRRRF